jgi:hypothetical protein
MTAADICHKCSHAIALAPPERLSDLPKSESGVPQWYPFEHAAWAIGEDIRLALKTNPKLRADPRVHECLLSVAEVRRLRRGRQPFILNLGFRAASPTASRVAALLDDPDVAGHALDTLLKMRADGFAPKVWPLSGSEFAWVRRLAKRYLKSYGG